MSVGHAGLSLAAYSRLFVRLSLPVRPKYLARNVFGNSRQLRSFAHRAGHLRLFHNRDGRGILHGLELQREAANLVC